MVPPELQGAAWVASREDGTMAVGALGSAELKVLGADQMVAAVGPRNVAIAQTEGSSVRIVILEATSGAELVSAVIPGGISGAVFAGNHLVVSRASGDSVDPGVVAVDITSGAIRDLIAEGPLPADWTGEFPARSVVASATGETVAASLLSFGSDAADVSVISMPDGNVRGSFRVIGHPAATTDTHLVLRVGGDSVDELVGVDLNGGATRWTLTTGLFLTGYATQEGVLVQQVYVTEGVASRTEILAVDMTSGASEVAWTTKDDYTLIPEVSRTSFAVLSSTGRLLDPQTGSSVALYILDLAGGALLPGQLVLSLD